MFLLLFIELWQLCQVSIDVLAYIFHHLVSVASHLGEIEVENLHWLPFSSVVAAISVLSRILRTTLRASVLAITVGSSAVIGVDGNRNGDELRLSLAVHATREQIVEAVQKPTTAIRSSWPLFSSLLLVLSVTHLCIINVY